MAECIVVTSGKGGVGKTTTSANLAAGIALAGKTCAVVDADIGLRNLDVVLGLENRIVYDLVQVIEGECRLKQALIRDKRVEGLFLLPAAQTRDKQSVTPDDMKRLVEDLKAMHDYVIIDCPAGIEQGFKNSVAGADRAVIVTTPEVSAIRDADRIIGLVEAHELPEPDLIINRYQTAMVERGDMMNREDILEILAIPLVGIVPDHPEHHRQHQPRGAGGVRRGLPRRAGLPTDHRSDHGPRGRDPRVRHRRERLGHVQALDGPAAGPGGYLMRGLFSKLQMALGNGTPPPSKDEAKQRLKLLADPRPGGPDPEPARAHEGGDPRGDRPLLRDRGRRAGGVQAQPPAIERGAPLDDPRAPGHRPGLTMTSSCVRGVAAARMRTLSLGRRRGGRRLGR